MTENKLKSMAENKKFEELMKNKKELERLSNITDISEVLEVLNKHGYNGNKQDLERDLFEILQGLSEDDLKNISGGKILNKKYLAGLMGGLTMMGAMGLTTSAQVRNQSNVKTKSGTSFVNKVDKTVVGVGVGSLLVGGVLVETLNLLFRDKRNQFKLTKEQQRIYENTEKLSDMILKYVEGYINANKKMPSIELNINDSAHQGILQLIKTIRNDWLTMYNNKGKITLTDQQQDTILRNEKLKANRVEIYGVLINPEAIEDLFFGLPVGNTVIHTQVTPYSPGNCTDSLNLLGKLWKLHVKYQTAFQTLCESVK